MRDRAKLSMSENTEVFRLVVQKYEHMCSQPVQNTVELQSYEPQSYELTGLRNGMGGGVSIEIFLR